MHLLYAATARAAPAACPAYRARLATGPADVRAAQALRFDVFNMELDEGLSQSYETGLDADPFDAVCDHLIIEAADGNVVGTYRLQTGHRAGKALGYYSEREFDFTPFEPMRGQMLELGRACIHHHHRNYSVLNLLWQGIARHAQQQGSRYLIGCSSLTSQDARVGLAAYDVLAPHLAPPRWRTRPRQAFDLAHDGAPTRSFHRSHGNAAPLAPAARIPRLLSAYLALGAAICGPPAIDREFKTIDFLTWIDIESPRMRLLTRRGRYTG